MLEVKTIHYNNQHVLFHFYWNKVSELILMHFILKDLHKPDFVSVLDTSIATGVFYGYNSNFCSNSIQTDLKVRDLVEKQGFHLNSCWMERKYFLQWIWCVLKMHFEMESTSYFSIFSYRHIIFDFLGGCLLCQGCVLCHFAVFSLKHELQTVTKIKVR